jgi:DNA polymerase-3 subunit gamma/tau
MALHFAMIKRKPEIESESIVTFTVDNVALEKDLNENKTSLLAFLRKNLSNYSIDLNVKVEASPLTNENPYTPSEKFKKLAEKNPLINELKKKFDLEIEY